MEKRFEIVFKLPKNVLNEEDAFVEFLENEHNDSGMLLVLNNLKEIRLESNIWRNYFKEHPSITISVPEKYAEKFYMDNFRCHVEYAGRDEESESIKLLIVFVKV